MTTQNFPHHLRSIDQTATTLQQAFMPIKHFPQARRLCPCCSDILLRHIHQTGSYDLCRSCRQAMPNLTSIQIQHQ